MTARRWGLSFEINSRYLLGQWEPRKILAISTFRHASTRAKALLAGKARADKKRLVWNLTLALAGPARQPRRPRRHSSKSVERNARTMTTVTSALSARAVRLGAPRKVTRRLPSPTPTAPPSWNQPSDCTPARRRPMASSRARPDAPHARDERLALAADHRHAPPSSEQVAVRRPARVTARAATNPDADPARKPSVAKGASRLVSTATLGGIPVSLATALPALADDGGGGGGGAFGIVALIAVAGAAFVAGRGSGGGGGGGGDDDDPPPPTGSQDSKNYEKNLTIASGVQRKGRKPPKPKGL